MTLWLGLMSGTSMDSVDAVLVSFGEPGVNIHSTLSLPYPEQLRHRLLQAVRNQADPDEIGELDTLTGQHFAKAASDLIHSPESTRKRSAPSAATGRLSAINRPAPRLSPCRLAMPPGLPRPPA